MSFARSSLRSFSQLVARPSATATATAGPSTYFTAARTMRAYSTENKNGSSSSASTTEAGKEGSQQATSSGESSEVIKKLEDLESQVKELKSQLTYGKADFINLQRRSEQEKASAKDFAIQSFASDLLGTIDILTTALKYVKQPIPAENTELKTLYSGVEMTTQELLKTLAKHGVTQFDPSKPADDAGNGAKFDANTMEAMYQAPIPGKQPGTVMDCQKLGYMLKGRTLRAAQVGVVQEQ